ncbi:MAG TPA: hypothetical protein VE993_20695, partial [Stellaceae bacterium]|nr:hypothetical protein [Stellaceae bacterium]
MRNGVGRGRGRRRETDGERRQSLIEPLQHLVRDLESLVEKDQIGARQHQVRFPLLRDVGNDLQNRLLNFGQRFAVRFFKRLALALDAAVESIDLFLECAAFLIE